MSTLAAGAIAAPMESERTPPPADAQPPDQPSSIMTPIEGSSTRGATECDVLIVGGGPSGSTTARLLAESGFRVTVLEQGGWVNRSDLPGDKPERDLLAAGRWAWDPNVRRNRWDYPIDVSQSDIHPMNFNGVGGSSVFFGAEWPRLWPSDLASSVPRAGPMLVASDTAAML